MENLDIARELDTMADLLEIQGANPFRIRAYRNAVNTVRSSSRSLAAMVAAGEDLRELPDIGDNVGAHIVELLETGRITRLEEVAAEFPRTLADLVHLEGLGPKKVRKLFEELEVRTVDDLELALSEGRVQTLDGFGKKSAEKLLLAIEDHRKHTGRFRIHETERLIEGVLSHMEGTPGVTRLEVAGSLRRRKETIGDVDLIAECEGDGTPVVDHFVAFPGAVRVLGSGSTKGSLVLHSGLQVDLRVVPAESFGAALVYFTGSKEHNVSLRTRAVREGLRVNEWGVFQVPDEDAPGAGAEATDGGSDGGGEEAPGDRGFGARVAGPTEEGVYASLGLAWVPPELRENRGEIEAALADKLPRLVTLDDLRGDLQMHSTWSDGRASLEEMVRACLARGYTYMAVTDHTQAMAMVGGLTPERARAQWVELDEVRERVPEMLVLRSAEVDILKDGSLDFPDEILEELDLVLISVHSFMDQDRKTMTDRVLRAMAHPTVDILAHPMGRIINRREPYELDVEAVLEAAAELSVAIELNASPNRLDLDDIHVHRAKELGVPVVISTDAHAPEGLADMRYGVSQARRGWLEPTDVLNARSRSDFEAWLRRRDAVSDTP
jgi:DNA polymerase (family 10)